MPNTQFNFDELDALVAQIQANQTAPQPVPSPAALFANWQQGPHTFAVMDDIIPAPVVPQEHSNEPLTFNKIVSYPQIRANKRQHTDFQKTLPPLRHKFVMDNALVGIEIEVENIRVTPTLNYFWEAKADGSLRNNGVEFVSIPLAVNQIEHALGYIHEAITTTNKPDYSNRTSIHIHLNCRDLTQDQLFVLVTLYAIFEKHFYYFAGTRRLNSIFCVPIYRTNILAMLSDLVYNLSPKWHKYCGLNLLPMVSNGTTGTYGTIEFRHLHGTGDIKLIMEWINSILCLRKAALEIPKKELMEELRTMNTTSSYMALYHRVFADVNKFLREKDDFESCISNVKREYFGNDFQSSLRKTDKSAFWRAYNNLNLNSIVG